MVKISLQSLPRWSLRSSQTATLWAWKGQHAASQFTDIRELLVQRHQHNQWLLHQRWLLLGSQWWRWQAQPALWQAAWSTQRKFHQLQCHFGADQRNSGSEVGQIPEWWWNQGGGYGRRRRQHFRKRKWQRKRIQEQQTKPQTIDDHCQPTVHGYRAWTVLLLLGPQMHPVASSWSLYIISKNTPVLLYIIPHQHQHKHQHQNLTRNPCLSVCCMFLDPCYMLLVLWRHLFESEI